MFDDACRWYSCRPYRGCHHRFYCGAVLAKHHSGLRHRKSHHDDFRPHGLGFHCHPHLPPLDSGSLIPFQPVPKQERRFFLRRSCFFLIFILGVYMYLLIVCLLLCALFVSLSYIHRYCINPYFLHLVVGSKGSGKSLYMSRIADQWYREHRGDVFSNMGIGFPLKEKYWLENYPPDSLILIDEIGVIHPDRDFKSFPYECMEWYKMSRKRRLTIVCSSQTMDVDKKIRMLCDKIYVCRKISFLCMMTPYRAAIVMVENEEKGHDLVNDLKRSGKRVFYSIPKTALITEKLGYETEQIISRPTPAGVNNTHGQKLSK